MGIYDTSPLSRLQREWLGKFGRIDCYELGENPPAFIMDLMQRHGVEAVMPIVEPAWSGSSAIHIHEETWHGVWDEIRFTKRNKPRKTRYRVMRKQDRESLLRMPDTIPIFRGYADNDNGTLWSGFSWTIDRSVAERFARNWEKYGRPYIASTTIAKEDVFAFFNRRPEAEIVIDPDWLDVDKVHIEKLPPAIPLAA